MWMTPGTVLSMGWALEYKSTGPQPQVIHRCSHATASTPQALCDSGYSAQDIITILFRVVRGYAGINEFLKLEYIKQIGFCHMRIADGVGSRLQLSGLLAELCKLSQKSKG